MLFAMAEWVLTAEEQAELTAAFHELDVDENAKPEADGATLHHLAGQPAK